MTEIEDDEPALLLVKHVKEDGEFILIYEKGVVPKLVADVEQKQVESNFWYLDDEQAIT